MPSFRYSEYQIRVAEESASDVFDKKLSMADGVRHLVDAHGFNANSAKDFIANYRCMLQGRLFQRSLGAATVDHYLTSIASKRGGHFLALAISAIDQHIVYYESVVGQALPGLRAVANKHRDVAPLLSFAEHAASFEAAVDEAMNDTQTKRLARLAKAPSKPQRVRVSAYIFTRNADVVAEVLHRANGMCERCENPAPFCRKKNGEPYLEVHHVLPLSEDGDDVVENAIALCPTCHRLLHFGIEIEA
jgi:5-methylcytosine-specific restriction protein A